MNTLVKASKGVKSAKASKVLDGIQVGLAVVGMIPGVGNVASLVDAGISFARGDILGGVLGLVGAIPIVGNAFKAIKVGRLGFKALKTLKMVNKQKAIVGAAGAKGLRKIVSNKPIQIHHFATNKSKKFTKEFNRIIKKYGLDLDKGSWNKAPMRHQGRHPNAYHKHILDEMRRIDRIAKGNVKVFLDKYKKVTDRIRKNPEMLTKKYWSSK